jgi:uncharacterized membrane protein required for colicin V production
MGLLLDGIVIAIFLGTIYYAKKQGFMKIVAFVVGAVLIFVLGITMSPSLADYTYTEIIEPKVINSVENIVIDGTKETLDTVWDSFPKWITKNAAKMDISKEALDEIIMDNYGNDAKATLTDVSERLIKPGVIKMLEVLFAIVIVAALWAVLGGLANFLNSLFKGDKLKAVNSTLAVCLGVVGGLVLVLIFCNFIEYVINVFPNGILFFTMENISETDIFKFFMNIV